MDFHLAAATTLINLFYNRFRILNFPIGLYSFFDVMPPLGDIISILLAIYLLWIAWKINLPQDKRSHMVRNIMFDLVFGAIPVVGDVVDTIYRAHVRNLSILQDYRKSHAVMDAELASKNE